MTRCNLDGRGQNVLSFKGGFIVSIIYELKTMNFSLNFLARTTKRRPSLRITIFSANVMTEPTQSSMNCRKTAENESHTITALGATKTFIPLYETCEWKFENFATKPFI